jgi:hypothetical protein
MANVRPSIIAPDGAVVFTPSESADSAETYNSPIIAIATRTGKRYIKFSVDTSNKLTVTEVDKAGNTCGLGVIVNAVTVNTGTQYPFLVGPTNLRTLWDPGYATGQVSPQTGQNGVDVFIFENGASGSNQGMGGSTTTAGANPSRAMAGTSLEVNTGAGGQVN